MYAFLLLCSAMPAAGPSYLLVSKYEVGASGDMSYTDAEIVQVLDDSSMLVSVSESFSKVGNSIREVVIRCPTKGLVDGQSWKQSEWKAKVGFDAVKVTGTTRLTTAGGGTKTVFVLTPKK